jgi:replicative DNA helicase
MVLNDTPSSSARQAADAIGCTRTSPAAWSAEQRVLGALLTQPDASSRLLAALDPERFADPVHGAIFATIAACCEAGQSGDIQALAAEFQRSGVLDAAGGLPYLAELAAIAEPVSRSAAEQVVVGAFDVDHDVRAIRDAWMRRRLIVVAEEALHSILWENAAPAGVARVLMAQLTALAQRQEAADADHG